LTCLKLVPHPAAAAHRGFRGPTAADPLRCGLDRPCIACQLTPVTESPKDKQADCILICDPRFSSAT
jgi:hypothetical protein